MKNKNKTVKPELRREHIVDRVRERERAAVEDLAAWLGTSRETIRRDLTILAATGRIRKYHGGASLSVQREGRFAQRMIDAVPQKRAIATATATLFPAGSTIFLDVGTTTLMLADEFARRSHLTIITNGIDIAKKLSASKVKVFLIGGELNPDTAESVGTLAVEQIARFFASDAVITVAGLSSTGAMDFQLDEAQIARAMIAQARALTVIADSSKLGREALFQVCPLEAIDRLVVDTAPAAPLAAALAAAGVTVIVANPCGRVDTE